MSHRSVAVGTLVLVPWWLALGYAFASLFAVVLAALLLVAQRLVRLGRSGASLDERRRLEHEVTGRLVATPLDHKRKPQRPTCQSLINLATQL